MEIERIELFDELPSEWTYPLIHPKFIQKVESIIGIGLIYKKEIYFENSDLKV